MALDLSELKARYPLEQVVEERTGQQIVRNKIHCPFHEDRTPSLHIYADGRWRCFGRCGRHGDVFDFVGYLLYGEAYDPSQHLREVIDALGGLDIKPAPYKPTRKLRPTINPALVEHYRQQMTRREYAYWKARRIPPVILHHFKVGWTGQRHAFPWYYRNQLTAIKMRRDEELTPHLEPKYLSVKGSRFTAPYGIDNLFVDPPPVRVLICEDEKSVLAAASRGMYAVSVPANAFKEEWVNLFAHIPEVVIVADNDAAGQESGQRLLAMLGQARLVSPPNIFLDDGTHIKDLFDAHRYLRDVSWIKG